MHVVGTPPDSLTVPSLPSDTHPITRSCRGSTRTGDVLRTIACVEMTRGTGRDRDRLQPKVGQFAARGLVGAPIARYVPPAPTPLGFTLGEVPHETLAGDADRRDRSGARV